MNSISSTRMVLALFIGLLCSSLSSPVAASTEENSSLQQIRMTETDARESKQESDKKPPREVRKAQQDAAKAAKKDPKKGP